MAGAKAMLNPRQVEAFRAVIVTGGVTTAARAMNLTQPAVTRLIHDFQREVGLALFTRRGVRLVPTTEALSLYREVERQFVGLDRIAAAARELRERRVGALRIAALPAFGAGFLPRFVGRYLADRPGVTIALFSSISSQVSEWVASGFCDIGFAQSPLDHPSLAVEPLPTAPAVAALPDGHRLAGKDEVGPADFAGEPFISLEQSTPLRYRIDAAFMEHGAAPVARVETPLSMIACGLVASGAGLAVVDPYTAHEYEGRGVVVRPFRPRLQFEIACLWSIQRTRSALAVEFAEQFAGEMRRFAEGR
jgi:DNA-binding transcriptional LysR family regulator